MRIHRRLYTFTLAVAVISIIFVAPVDADASDTNVDELAKQLANPVAALASVPFQLNYDANIGPDDDGQRYTLNVQPVIPFELNERWNLISRTIIPVVYQDDIFRRAGSQTGLGDAVQSLFFSPRPGPSGLIWGVGPVLLLPTATDDLLGTEKWGLGPTGVVLKQTGPWTYGGLANHIRSVAGNDDRADIASTYLNPFVSYRFTGGWTLGAQAEHTLDHENDQDTGQCSVFLSKVTRIGSQMVSFTVAPRYWYETSPSSPEGLGFRFNVTLLFPR